MHATARIASVFFGAALTLGVLAGVTPAQADGSQGDSDRPHRAGAEVDTSDWPQGKSLSDPDGGDMDKPGGTAGTVGDQDGNNGCGNDEDRDDDNNGNCERQDQAAEAQACHVKEDKARHDDEADDDEADDEVRAHHQSKAKRSSADDVDDADDESGCPESDDTATAAGSVTGTATRVEAAASAAPVSASAAAAAPATTVAGAVEVAGTDTTTTTPPTEVLGITETAPDTLARTGAGLGGLVLAAGACLGGGRLTSLVRRLFGS
jgi:hypothetical protein